MSAVFAQVIERVAVRGEKAQRARAEAELIRRALVARGKVAHNVFALAAVSRGNGIELRPMAGPRLTRLELDDFLLRLAHRAAEGSWSVFYCRPQKHANAEQEHELTALIRRLAGFETDHGWPLVDGSMVVNTGTIR